MTVNDFDLEDARRQVSALHFTKEALTDLERDVLRLAESLLREVERLQPPKPSPLSWSPPTIPGADPNCQHGSTPPYGRCFDCGASQERTR
jgi:hypothetical protein